MEFLLQGLAKFAVTQMLLRLAWVDATNKQWNRGRARAGLVSVKFRVPRCQGAKTGQFLHLTLTINFTRLGVKDGEVVRIN